MAGSGKKVFISWSGSPSKEIALALGTWLEEVYDDIQAWVSDRDIEAGARSMKEIEDSLRDACAGIIVVTRGNMTRPWINFEAGALSKALHDEDRNRVIPLLVDFNRTAELEGPMSILQAVMLDEDGITRIMRSLNAVLGLDPDKAARRVSTYWAVLEDDVQALRQLAFAQATQHSAEQPWPVDAEDEKVMLPEMLEILRAIRDGDINVAQPSVDAAFRTRTGMAYTPRAPYGTVYALVQRWIADNALEGEFVDVVVKDKDRGESGWTKPEILLVTDKDLPRDLGDSYRASLAGVTGVKSVRILKPTT